jgi:hypothetical protein
MIKYIHDAATGVPKKKIPWEPSDDEWAELSTQMFDIDPTNINRKNILRDEAWVKSTWNDVRKYLHQVFIQYNRSGQHSGDMGEWCSPEEQQRWIWAALWRGGGTNSIVRFPTVMIYSIAVLEQSDFEALGRQMPQGSGVDNPVAASIYDGAQSRKKRKKHGKYNNNNKNKSPNNNTLLTAIESGTRNEMQLSALRLLLEFGSESQKKTAIEEVERLAVETSQPNGVERRVAASNPDENGNSNSDEDEAESVDDE